MFISLCSTIQISHGNNKEDVYGKLNGLIGHIHYPFIYYTLIIHFFILNYLFTNLIFIQIVYFDFNIHMQWPKTYRYYLDVGNF